VQVLQPTTRIRYFGDYELLEEIGRGGMGVVYKARQVSLDRLLALKLILSGQLAGEEEVHRFHTEAAAAANLEHPNIMAIHETGEHDGQHYFSMQLVEGVPLTDLAELYRQDPRRSARLLRKVAGAVHHAHQRGILHRDLKPANILVDDQDEPHLTDFGLAKRVDLPGELTRTDTTLGTPDYMSPEQAQGHHRLLTVASDVWSLGAVLYYLLTGRPPILTLVLGSASVLWQWRRAEQEGLAARQVVYVLAIRSAQHALEASDLGEARSLLDQCQPTQRSVFGHSPDLRHWEWRYLRERCRGDEWFALGGEVRNRRASSGARDLTGG
jgi:serine/threonine protein kinase